MTPISSQCSGTSVLAPVRTDPFTGSRRAGKYPGDDASARPSDTVELSSRARELSKAASNTPPIRADLVARVRQELAAGTYERDAKVNGAVDKIVQSLNSVG
jgi:flagellar biosynthesis anti-sigma factor FlgM